MPDGAHSAGASAQNPAGAGEASALAHSTGHPPVPAVETARLDGHRPNARDQIAGLTFGLLLVGPDLHIREVNPAAESLIGRSARRLVGRGLFDVLDLGQSRLPERLHADEAQLIARNLPLRVGERSLRVNLTVSPLSADPGWRVVTLSDTGQGERLGDDERTGTLRGPAILAHEIKNPLSAIKGAAQLLARKVAAGEQALTELIVDEVDRIASLVDRMQRLGREKAEPVVPCNLHAAIRRACVTVRAASSVPFTLVEEFDPSLPPVLANEGALVQILVNLVSNARDACAEFDDPQVTIRTRFVSGLVMNVFRLGRPVKLPIEVQVSDNGPGIDPALADSIFEPFVSSKPNGQGLGLALVHKLVRDMDGRIGQERDELAGLTHFRVHLPQAADMARRALLVEDDGSIATVITAGLEEEAFVVDRCDRISERDRLLAANEYDVMLTDVVLLDGDGIATLGEVADRFPELPVIILSAQNTLDTAIRASDARAFEYFPKPFDLDELVRAACQAADARRGEEPVEPDQAPEGLPLIGRSQPMQEVYRMITRVLRNDLSVLVLGESGTGKELVAEAIHQLGSRKEGPFVAVNAAAIPRELIESELFGHEKGAFTGAVNRSVGKFEQANGGTLFLDEIGDMPPEAQTRLLRALQSGRIRRVGGQDEIAIDVRIVAATNRDLAPMIAEGLFREDLFYRLNVVPIRLPPLRQRAGDIEPLARHFLRRAAREGLPARTLGRQAATLLGSREWRGNVRELRNFMYRAALFAREEEIDAETLRQLFDDPAADERPAVAGGTIDVAVADWLTHQEFAPGTLYHGALAAFEKPLFEHALARTGGNQVRAAQLLGINRNTLRKRLDDLAIDPERFGGRA